MKAIAYSSPFVPPEWIAVHGLRPVWLRLRSREGRPSAASTRGICPYVAALIEAADSGIAAAGLVLTTVCDQMRYAAALLESRGGCPVFLLNVPSTWQTATVRRLYLDELRRLGRFLTELGTKALADGDLARVMLACDRARNRDAPRRVDDSAAQSAHEIGTRPLLIAPQAAGRGAGVPLAVLGGPLLDSDDPFFDLVERAGGRVVLDATEGSRRTMPRRFDPARVASDPLEELANAYFEGIPDAFRRPNSSLYQWLERELAARRVRGIILRRYLWCDLWHAELHRLKEWSPVPVLDVDVGSDDANTPGRAEVRIEAFLESLR